jgi:hypothetical protein
MKFKTKSLLSCASMSSESLRAPSRHSRRQHVLALLTFPFLNSGCEAKTMHGTFEVILFSYLDRTIFEVLVSGFEIGAAGEYPYSGGASMSGVTMKYGPHKVSWRLGGPEGMARNGETVRATNEPVLARPPASHRFLGVHIYTDNTVEFVTSVHFPELSERGRAFDAAWRAKHGTFEVVLFSYLDRPIFDVLLSGFDIGVSGAWAGNFPGGGSMSGVSVKYGPHKVSWRLGGPEGMARNGETVRAANEPVLARPPADHRFLCVHVYPDDTVELVTSVHFPNKTERGIAMADALRNKHGR